METTPKTLTKSGNQSQDRRITHPRLRTFRLGGATNRINSARLYRNPRRRILEGCSGWVSSSDSDSESSALYLLLSLSHRRLYLAGGSLYIYL